MPRFHVPVPPQVGDRALTSLSSAQSVTEQIAAAIEILHGYLDKRIARYRRDRLIQEFGFRVARGLPSADAQSIARAGRQGLLIDGVTKTGQFRAIAAGRAARGMLERVALAPITGASLPSTRQMDDLVRTGESLMVLETFRAIAELADRTGSSQSGLPHLGNVAIEAHESVIDLEYWPVDFDLERWVRLVERPIGRGEIDLDLFADLDQDPDWVAPELREISEAAVQDLGFSVNDLLDALTVLLRQCTERGYEFLGFDEVPVGLGVPKAAVDYLTFSDEYLSLADLRPSDTRHQRRRLWTSPLLKRGNRYYVFRDIVFEALLRWTRYLTQGDWPVPRNVLKETAPNLHRALESRSRESGPRFERYLDARLEETGLPRATLKNGARVGVVTLSREIDSVVIDPDQRRIHVLEAKNMSSDQNAKSLQNELAKYLGEYAEKLLRSVHEVELDKLAFVKRVLELHKSGLGEIGDAESWSVEAAFVFSSHSPIECLSTPRFFVGISADRVSELFVSRA